MNDLRSILVGLDFTSASEAALDGASRIAGWNGAKVYVLHVVDPSIGDGVFGLVGRETDQSWDAMREEVLDLPKKVAAEGNRAVGAWVGVGLGSPIARLIGAIRDHAADLPVLGNQGKTSLRSPLLGGTAERALAELPCSALVVKRAGFAAGVD